VLRGVSLDVGRGEILGLLGPNGAGKSSALLCLVGLVPAEAGEVLLDGAPAAPGSAALRARTGVVFQHPALDGKLSARENLRLGGRLHGLRGAALRARVEEALRDADLEGRADEPTKRLSGGMRRRVEMARALLHDPDLLLLDEPTTGLDQASFRRTWDALRERARVRGLAALLTTHRADEAERCDRLAVLSGGVVVASDTPEALRRSVGGDVLELAVEAPDEAAATLRESLGLEAEVEDGAVRVVAEDGHGLVPRVVEALPRGALRSLTVRGPDLADAYLRLTGERLEAEEGDR
jgi:ABC-2 type transport system ATP-binding protein